MLVLLDAFGERFLERYGDSHPLLRRLRVDGDVQPLATQFPSTTTAHVTTMHTGLSVGGHGLYEWNVLEPSLGAIITPLRFSFAGDRESDTLIAAGFTAEALVPEPTFYERLRDDEGVTCTAFQPAAFSPSTFDSIALRGADLRTYTRLADAVTAAVEAVAAVERGYAYLYFDGIDAAGHLHGPSSPEFDAAVMTALDAVTAGLRAARPAPRTHLLLTADHGQVDVDPARTLWLDELWPPLTELLDLRPAGSSRDVFLHVAEARVPEVVAGLRGALGDAAQVRPVSELLAEGRFGTEPGPRLLERLGTVCVLPEPSRMAWLRGAADVAQDFRGHHGGLTPEETRTYLASLPLAP